MARNRLRQELEQLASEVERLGVQTIPLVLEVDHRDLDDRYGGDEDTFLRHKFPKGFPLGSPTPFVIVLGPDHIEPPLDSPFASPDLSADRCSDAVLKRG